MTGPGEQTDEHDGERTRVVKEKPGYRALVRASRRTARSARSLTPVPTPAPIPATDEPYSDELTDPNPDLDAWKPLFATAETSAAAVPIAPEATRELTAGDLVASTAVPPPLPEDSEERVLPSTAPARTPITEECATIEICATGPERQGPTLRLGTIARGNPWSLWALLVLGIALLAGALVKLALDARRPGVSRPARLPHAADPVARPVAAQLPTTAPLDARLAAAADGTRGREVGTQAPRGPLDLLLRARAAAARGDWPAVQAAVRGLPRRWRGHPMITLWKAELARDGGELERARELYGRLVEDRGALDRVLRAAIALDFSEVLLQREFRTAALYQARRAAALLDGSSAAALARRARAQIARCLAARDVR